MMRLSPNAHNKPMGLRQTVILAVLLLFALLATSCQQESDDESGGGVSGDSTAPVITVSPGSNCAGTTSISCITVTPTITLSANETATIYYSYSLNSNLTVTTSDSSSANSASVNLIGSEGETWYIAYFAVDSAGNLSTTSITSVTLLSAPQSNITITSTPTTSFVNNYCTFLETSALTRTYTCIGEVSGTISAVTTANGETIEFAQNVNSPSGSLVDSGAATTSFKITENRTFLEFRAKTSAGKAETVKTYTFLINGIVPNNGVSQIQSGYYGSDVTFKLSLAQSERNLSTNYQTYYNYSTDSTGDVASIFDSTPAPVTSSVLYHDQITGNPSTESDLQAQKTQGETTIYQYKYNLIYNDTGNTISAGKIYPQDGSTDNEATLTLYVDDDNPSVSLLPPSGGSLESTMSVSTFIYDKGHEKVERFRSENQNFPGFSDSNSKLPESTPSTDSGIYPQAWYCSPDASYSPEFQNFWLDCDSSARRTVVASSRQLDISSDTYFIMQATDKAGNTSNCYDPTAPDQVYDCKSSAPSPQYANHYFYRYTPGMQSTQTYHKDEFSVGSDQIRNFGHAVASGFIDNVGGANDIVVGAPAYSSTDSGVDANGAVYLWYNGFRERAQITFSLTDSSVDISLGIKYMQFSTDGNASLRVYLDPSDDTSSYLNPKYQAYNSPDSTSDPYVDKSKATAQEIARVLNKAFQSSLNQNYKNHLFAEASGEQLTIGHLNQSTQGYFEYSTGGFDTTSDLYRSSSANPIKAYDYKITGESQGSEFGYSLAIGYMDQTPDVNYSSKHVVVGAPGYAGGNGAMYVIQVPASEASADFGDLDLSIPANMAQVHSVYASDSSRFGSAVVTIDASPDDNVQYQNIFVSAPKYNNTSLGLQESGAVYSIPYQDFVFDATSDITTIADDTIVWAGETSSGTNNDGNSAAYALFGTSLIGGTTQLQSNRSNPALYIGAPGRSDAPQNVKGRVLYVDLKNYHGNYTAGLESVLPPSTYSANYDLFGTSLAVVDSGFNTNPPVTGNTPTICPCLAVGAPGVVSEHDKGIVWVLGVDGYAAKVDGTIAAEGFGKSIVSGKIGIVGGSNVTEQLPTIVIGSKYYSEAGRITVVRPQGFPDLNSIFDLTAQTKTFESDSDGENFGGSLSIIRINANSDNGLIVGSSGKSSTQMGGVRIYSPTRLLSN